MALDHANAIIDWHENVPKAERPPRWMWHLDDEMAEHWKQVEADREAQRNGESPRSGDEVPDLEQNELTAHLRRR